MTAQRYMQLELDHGDKVVSVCQYRGYIVIVTERGVILKVEIEDT